MRNDRDRKKSKEKVAEEKLKGKKKVQNDETGRGRKWRKKKKRGVRRKKEGGIPGQIKVN